MSLKPLALKDMEHRPLLCTPIRDTLLSSLFIQSMRELYDGVNLTTSPTILPLKEDNHANLFRVSFSANSLERSLAQTDQMGDRAPHNRF